MNIILFNQNEVDIPLLKNDPRHIHLVKVLHKKEGDYFECGIIGGKCGRGRIERIDKDNELFFSLELPDEPPKKLTIRVAVGFPRPIQLRRVLRELSNMGVNAIDLLETELGDKSYRQTKLFEDGGAHAALIEGAEQARDTIIPAVKQFKSIKTWITSIFTGDFKIDDTLLLAPDNIRPQMPFEHIPLGKKSAILIIGSERGISDNERLLLEEYNFIRFSLGNRALRTETACVAAVSLAMEKLKLLS